MPKYTLESHRMSGEFEFPDAETARRGIAKVLGREGIDSGTVISSTGQRWTLEHDHRSDGLNGWMFSDGKTRKRVYPKVIPRPGTLWAGGWQGIYDLGKGRMMNAFDSDQFEDEDFALVGAVYYAIYEDGDEVDGGWFGYYEDTTWNDFLQFANLRNPRLVVKESEPRYTEILDMIEDGEYNASMNSPKRKRVKPVGSSKTVHKR